MAKVRPILVVSLLVLWDGRACACLFAKPPNDRGGNGLLQEDAETLR